MYTDGGARGNPGPAGVGVVIKDADSGQPVFAAGFFLGKMTNNQAEYTGLIRGLEAALKAGVTHLSAFSDSELMVKQVNGEYRVKSTDLKPLYQDASALLRRFESATLSHVRREKNKDADALANQAMDFSDDVLLVGLDSE